MDHELKIYPEYYEAIKNGTKTFEVRRNDKSYQEGDRLILREWADGAYSGRFCDAEITYILNSSDYCKEGFVILGIRILDFKRTIITDELLESKGFRLIRFPFSYEKNPDDKSYVSYQPNVHCILLRNEKYENGNFEHFAVINKYCDTWEEACRLATLAGINLEK